MNNEPNKEFLRWSDVVNWLGTLGISVRQVKKFKSEGKIKTYKMRGGIRAYYLKQQIKKDVLDAKRYE